MEKIPEEAIAQLKDRGRLIAPVGSGAFDQYLYLIEKEGKRVETTALLPVAFVGISSRQWALRNEEHQRDSSAAMPHSRMYAAFP